MTTDTDTTTKARPRPGRLIRLTEAFHELGMSSGAGYDALKHGTLPFETFRIGGVWKCRRADVEAIVGAPLDAA